MVEGALSDQVMMNKIGVMQGRLLPKFQGRYQAHPVNYWQDEFFIAEKIGLDCIEFIFDFNDFALNPLYSYKGLNEIAKISQTTGVKVITICADYFMEAPIHSDIKSTSEESLKILERLIQNASSIKVSDIVIPCVDHSSIQSLQNRERFKFSLEKILTVAEKYNVNISLETDLSPEIFSKFLNEFSTSHLKVNYDIGNSASLGYDPIEELEAYGTLISDVHIKDRKLNGGPEILGYGDANFEDVFKKLAELGYQGPFIMQAYRDDEGVSVFKSQLNYIKKYFNLMD